MQISSQLDYQKINYAHPTYKYNKIFSITGLQTQTISTAGGQENIFEIPVTAFNLAQSFLQFTVTATAAGANNANWFYNDVFATIRQIQLYKRRCLFG